MQKVLILGGTSFIGRNLVAKLIELNQFEIHLFNRGETNPGLFPEVNKIIGDRNTEDIKKIAAISWDYVIDLSCYFPASIANILQYLNPKLKRYIYISSVSAYQLKEEQLHQEASLSLKNCEESQAQDTSDQSYGNRKAECERILQAARFDYIILRPALVYGPYDPTDRFYYWLYQVKTKNQILIPEKGENLLSLSFVKDLVACIIQAIDIPSHRQTYNAISTTEMSIKQIIVLASKILNRSPALIFVAPEIFHQQKLQQWVDIPLWIEGNWWTYSNQKLIEDFDLSFTSFEESLRETIQYYAQLNWQVPSYGISEDQRKNLIEQVLSS